MEGKPAAVDRFEELWPHIRNDLRELQDFANPLTPTAQVGLRLGGTRRPAMPYPAGRTMRSLLDRIPESIQHMIIIQRLTAVGGSETIALRLIEALGQRYRDGRLGVLAPDQMFNVAHGIAIPDNIPVVSINEIDPTMDTAARLETLDRILVERRPATVHSLNSMIAWTAFEERGAFYAQDSALFGNIYSDLRIDDGLPAAYFFWKSLPKAIENMAGIFADNRYVIDKARENFGLPRDEIARHYVVPTPVLGLPGGGLAIRPYREGAPKCSLWMSRIAAEKLPDTLRRIAEKCPDRQFEMYGSQALDAPIDLSWVGTAGNVTLRGQFGRLSDLPIDSFDSYVFTTSGEGMPITVLEVAALGLPIVAPDVGGIGEFIDGDSGWLVSGPAAVEEYVEALKDLRAHPKEAARRVAVAQKRLRDRHTLQAFRRRLEEIPRYLHH